MIIGIIPNKDDGWILEANLKILSRLCDKVIVGLDNCSDNSESIINKFDNTLIVNNPTSKITKKKPNRRQALLKKAREFSKNPIIIAIDADEIFSEEILNEENIKIIKNLDYGTTLNVKFRELWFSPYFYRSENKSVWAGRLLPCIWKDNGKDYDHNNWHELRVPKYLKSKTLDVDLIHFGRVRPHIYWSKIRFYIARDVYLNNHNPIRNNFLYSITHSEKDMILSPLKKKWFPSFNENIFLELQKNDSYFNSYNDTTLEFLLEDDNSSLKLADIWDFDWIRYYEIRKAKKPDEKIIHKLSDKRSDYEKKISYYIRINNTYPIYSLNFYINLVKFILIKINMYELARSILSKK